MKSNTLLLLLFLLLFSACRKDIDEIRVNKEEDSPAVFIKNTIRGKVVDETGVPIANANVTVEDEIIQSDADGCFLFNSVTIKKDGTIVTASSDEFFDGISHSNFAADGSSFVEIRMMHRGDPQFVESVDGGTVTNNDNLKINIPPDALVYENGNLYEGPVKVYARWLDPTDENIGATMPGALIASDENGNRLALVSYGMAVIELEADNGAKLELKEGAEMELDIPIPPELLADAPEEIDLWLFDLEEEEWLLKGKCNKVGGNYKCMVSQTGYWNCDVGVPAICLTGQVFNSDSSYSAYLRVIVEDLTDNFIYWGYTDSTGYFCGSVPQAAPLRLTIKDHCDNVVHTEDILSLIHI